MYCVAASLCRDAHAVREIDPPTDFAGHDFAEDLRVVIAVKGRVPAKKDVGDDPDRPNVTCLVVLLLQDL